MPSRHCPGHADTMPEGLAGPVSAGAAEGQEDHRDSISENRKLVTKPAMEARYGPAEGSAPTAGQSVDRRSSRLDWPGVRCGARCARLADIYAPTGHQGGQRLQSTGHYRPTPLDRAGRRGPRDVGWQTPVGDRHERTWPTLDESTLAGAKQPSANLAVVAPDPRG